MLKLPCPRVTQEELDAWPAAREVLRSKAGDVSKALALRNKLILSVYPLVFRMVGRRSAAKPHLEFAALYEAAMNGIFNALKQYNPAKSWSLWATIHVRQQMGMVKQPRELLILDSRIRGESKETRLNRLFGSRPFLEERVGFEWLDRGLDSLDGLEHELVVKCVIDGDTLSSVARRHGCSREWARKKQEMALRKLRQAHDYSKKQLYQMA